jgi:hypothetical protein
MVATSAASVSVGGSTATTGGSRLVELQMGQGSATPPPLVNGNGVGSEQRRKSARQSQQGQHLVTSQADQDDRSRELQLGLEVMNKRNNTR